MMSDKLGEDTNLLAMEIESGKPAGSLTHRVVAHLTALIESGSYVPGDKLPAEAEIVRTQGVSRTVVREAISKLQAAGLVETRHGVGTFVRERRVAEPLAFETGAADTAEDVMAVLEVRIGMETEAAALAATRRTEHNLKAMAAAMEAFQKEMHSGRGAIDPDLQFHQEIARAAGNQYFQDIFAALRRKAIPRSRFQIDEREPQRQEYLRRIHNEHEDIYSAILRGDAEAARAAVRNHLGNSRERMRRAAEARARSERKRS